MDKFQGQEAPVVFFSMASSSGADAPRGIDFLMSRNRLNVLSLPGARELVAGLEIDPSAVELKGIAGEVRIHRLR